MDLIFRLVPIVVSALIAWLLEPSWWAFAMITGGVMFACDWIWGDRRLFDSGHGLMLMASGAALVVVSLVLATNIGMSLAEFVDTAKGLSRRERYLYLMPVGGIAIFLYGLIIFTIAWTAEREGRWWWQSPGAE